MKPLPKPVGQITAWSFSRLQDYRKCPQFAKCKHVDKLREPGNSAMDRGSAIDKMAEDFILGKTKVAQPEIQAFEAEFKELRKRKAVCQDQWAFNANWQETGWFDKDAWLRIKTDVFSLNLKTNVVLVVDNKTGKVREEHEEQVGLYALGALLKFPTADAVDARIWYLDHGIEIPAEPTIYTQGDIPRLKTYWLKQVKPMLNDTRFAPKPSSNCKYCHFRKDNGGPCKY
jgi:RecB family exonuclease